MTQRQDQKVGNGGIAIQSSGDTNLTYGYDAASITSIVDSLASQMPKMILAANEIIDERLRKFKEELIERFESDAATNNQAFADPDFIHCVADAQKAFARTGQADAHKTLIDLIGERSKNQSGNRRSFTLNESILIAPKLTSNELSELALCFIVRNVRLAVARSIESFGLYYQKIFDDLLPDIMTEDFSYDYLVAQRCATVASVSVSFLDCWRNTYPGYFMKGIEIEEFEGIVGSIVDYPGLIINGAFDRSGVQLGAISKADFDIIASNNKLTEEGAKNLWSKAISTLASDREILDRMRHFCPSLDIVAKIWSTSPLQNMQLTAVGTAIAHTRALQIPGFAKPDLAIWVN